jgi:hypothetical protein
MPKAFTKRSRKQFSIRRFMRPCVRVLKTTPPLTSRGNKPLELTFDQQLTALLLFHIEEHRSGQELLQFLEEDNMARAIAGVPSGGIRQSTFYEAINTRGLEQMAHVFRELCRIASGMLPYNHEQLGDLVAIDGSLIEASLTMTWADYRGGVNKAKAHVGFNLNRGIPMKIYLADGKSDERPYVSTILQPGETGVIDRYYQCYRDFDSWQTEEKHFVCRIRESSVKTCLHENTIAPGGPVFYDAVTLLGTKGINQTEKPVRVIGYTIDGKRYWLATDRFDLTAENLMTVYKLRWNIETFFGWWKQHLNAYHRLARSAYGMMVQLLAGLITYLLLAIYCHDRFSEPVSVKRVRQLRNAIRTESRLPDFDPFEWLAGASISKNHSYAKT